MVIRVGKHRFLRIVDADKRRAVLVGAPLVSPRLPR